MFLIHSILCKLKVLHNGHYRWDIMGITCFDNVIGKLKYWEIFSLRVHQQISRYLLSSAYWLEEW